MPLETVSTFLTARWLRLAMINYEVDPAVLHGRVPVGTALDHWNSHHFVSIVGFQFLDTRVLGVPVPFHRHFVEVNLRFHVRRVVDDEVRRGVVFLKEIVPRRAIAWVAITVYHEHYVALPMWREISDGRVAYGWRHRGQPCGLSVSFAGTPTRPSDDSEEAFITEHYWGYASQRDGTTMEYRVEHPRWAVWSASQSTFESSDIAALYGPEFAAVLARTPSSAFLADGSAIVVRRGV
jgi:uncharacterized protein YqjF (DUF2071 family)